MAWGLAAASALAPVIDGMAAGPPPFHHRTQVPFTYLRDYSGGHLDDEKFLAAIAANTPELLVLGKDAPLHHNWGPVAGTGGENQSFGQGEHIRRLPPGELREKTERIRTMVTRLRATGVRWIMPYICTMTIGGDPERRTGFWEFYDHWDEYAAFGIGAKPGDDPLQWMQRRPDGELHFYYPPDTPRYAPNRRWAACIHQPGWRRHLSNVVRLAGEVGYDGVYIDNNRSTRCHCEQCQQAFRKYIGERLSADEIRRDLGARRLQDVRLNADADPFLFAALITTDSPAQQPQLKPGADLYHVRLTWEFWTESKVEFLRELKAIGTRARGDEFHIFANTTAYSKGAYEPGRVSAVATFNQSEENGGETGAHPGLVPPEFGGPVGVTHNRRGFEYKFYQSLSNGMHVGMLTRPGHGLPAAQSAAVDQNPQTASLSIAESAAFGGGGGFKMQLAWDTRDSVRLWRSFFEKHGELYRDTEVWAPLGVIAFGEQFFCGLDKTHQEALRELSMHLIEKNVLFDLVHDGNLSFERLRRFRAVIVPAGVRSLSEEQMEIFRRYAAEARGSLIIARDDFGVMDEKCRPRARSLRRIEGASVLSAGVAASALLARLSEIIGRPGGLTDATGQAPSGVGVNAFIAPANDRAGAVLFHLVNYNVPLGRDRTDPPRPVRDLVASLPFPPGWRVTSVEAFSPHLGESRDVNFEQQGDRVRLRIPRLDLYKVIRIAGEAAP
jgi:hypothetical protein